MGRSDLLGKYAWAWECTAPEGKCRQIMTTHVSYMLCNTPGTLKILHKLLCFYVCIDKDRPCEYGIYNLMLSWHLFMQSNIVVSFVIELWTCDKIVILIEEILFSYSKHITMKVLLLDQAILGESLAL